MEKLLKNKRFFSILLLICLVGFLILPNICLADDFDDITLDEMGKYLELPQKDVQNLLHSLIQILTSEGIDLWSSGPPTNEQIAVNFILLNAAKIQALNHLLIDAPIEITKNIVKGAVKIARLIGVQDVSVVINELEKESVKMAVEYGMKSLFQNQIRVSPGAIEFKYHSSKSGIKEVVFQYVMIYQPLNNKSGEMVIRFYSPNSIEPPDPKKFNMLSSLRPPFLKHDILPFIVDIQGIVKDFEWVGNPSVNIDFPGFVPDFGIKPLNRLEYHLFKPFETKIREIEVIITKVTGKSLGITETISNLPEIVFNIWNKIKSGFLNLNPFEPAIVGQSVVEQELFGVRPRTIPKQSVVENVEHGLQQPVAAVEVGEARLHQSKPKQKLTLAEIQEKLDDIAERIDIINQETEKLISAKIASGDVKHRHEEVGEARLHQPKIEEIDEQELEKQEQEQEQKKEPEQEIPVIICAKSVGSNPARNKVIFNEIAWMGTTTSHNDEWIELTNISGKEINLNGWQVLDKENQIKIIFGRELFSANSYFLLERTDDNSAPNIVADFIYTGGLNNTNEALYLFDENCELQDEVVTASNWSYGDNSSKRTMERKTNLNWQTSANPGGTPKSSNSNGYYVYYGGGGGSGITPLPDPDPDPLPAPPKILISEVQIEAEKASYDFIELYNLNNEDVDIFGYQLKKKNQAGAEYSIKKISESVIIPSKQYLLWASSKDDYYQIISAELSSSSYLSQNNSIALLDRDKNIVDAIAWGASHINPFQEDAPFSQNPVENQTIGRKWDVETQKYQDTDKNQNDFEIQFPSPKAQNQTFRDIILPETIIDSKPSELTNQTQASFTFSASEQNCVFECRLNQENWETCVSPKVYEDLFDGEHTFSVRATDLAGNTQEFPAQYTWTIDTIAPDTEFLTYPQIITNQKQANFQFSASEQNSSFEYKLDKQGLWENCISDISFNDLVEGSHTFQVQATDLAGNTQEFPAQYTWIIDTTITNPCLLLSDLDSGSLFYTNEPIVNITILDDEEALFWLLSENGSEITNPAAFWQSIKPANFTLSDADGPKTVYIWIKDEAENISEGISDSIILDSASPVVEFDNLAAIQTSTAFSLVWSGQDSNSGISDYDIQYKQELTGEWQNLLEKTTEENYQFSGQNNSAYYFKIRARDKIGNESQWTEKVSTKIEQPILDVAPKTLNFEAIEFAQDPADKNLTISNIGFGDLSYQIVLSENNWLNVNSYSGQAPCQIAVSADISKMEPGEFTSQIKISSNAGSEQIPVVLNVQQDIIPPLAPTIISNTQNQILNTSEIVLSGATEPNALIFVASMEKIRADEQGDWERQITLQEGENIIEIKAEDEAGNQSEPTILTLILDTIPPETILSLENLPPSFTLSTTANFSFSANENCVFKCQIDALGWEDCESVKTYTELSQGYKIFQVKAIDLAGNHDLTPAIHFWTIDSEPSLEVVINEIAWSGTSAANSNDEWIELFNNTEQEIDLTGWTLKAADGTPEIELTGIIQAQNYFLLERTDDNTIKALSADQIYIGGLNNEGEKLKLRNADGKLIDLVDCSDIWFAGTASPNYISMERISGIVSGSDPDNWASNNLITRNGKDADGNKINGTPKAENSVSKTSTEIFYGLPFSEFDEITLTKLGAPYIIKWTLQVPVERTLIIDKGVVIKFFDNISGITVNGTLEAIGNTDEKIIFTSYKDDNYGGSGNASAGDWKQIYFSETSIAILDYVVIKYGGEYYMPGTPCFWHRAAIRVEESQNFVFKNSVVQHNKNKGLYLMNCPLTTLIYKVQFLNHQVGCQGCTSTDDAIAISIQGNSPVIEKCVFNKNTIGIKITSSALPQIKDNTFTENKKPIYVYQSYPVFSNNKTPGSNNNMNGIFVFGSNINQNTTWNADLPYIVDGVLVVSSDIVFTLKQGVVIKFYDSTSWLIINGTLEAIGNTDEKIIFTSYRDNEYGGSGAEPGDWKQIYFSPDSSDNSILDYVVVRYGGYWSGSDSCGEQKRAGIRVQGTSITFTNSILQKNKGTGFYLMDFSMTVDGVWFLDHEQGYRCGSCKPREYKAVAVFVENGTATVKNSLFRNNTENTRTGNNGLVTMGDGNTFE
ncbi:lamin tail domain-containing protein [Candidatus Parcubacteria bacterium]|nr:lamin tail domain-containing protein [Candidatus Parcubacteria bacterium]